MRLLFGRRLRAERHARHLTLEDVAEVADLNWSDFAQVEHGVRNISIDNMAALAEALNVRLSMLLNDAPE